MKEPNVDLSKSKTFNLASYEINFTTFSGQLQKEFSFLARTQLYEPCIPYHINKHSDKNVNL